MGVVNHLATRIEQFTKKIDEWENERQFGVDDIDNVDGYDETFFGGLDTESSATYVESPPIVVDINDKRVIPVKVLSTEPVKNRKGRKPKKDDTLENLQLLLDRYMPNDEEFWKLWGKNQTVLVFRT
ncbi:unnamed protein product [Lactuca saligna]|uniref:Uncharacterized protein n=1 Tax=Lactuca saligna TaxID=75948 RepID=A0AA35Y3A6_LACSI|nr:unnamed protein product [Lactuca saligna]